MLGSHRRVRSAAMVNEPALIWVVDDHCIKVQIWCDYDTFFDDEDSLPFAADFSAWAGIGCASSGPGAGMYQDSYSY